ncbi:MAG: GAF domain-containing sensor histidine kinase [Acidimicrobiia bacterium]
MDVIPTEIRERIRYEARVSGLSAGTALSIEAVEKRRLQIWIIAGVLVVALSGAFAVSSLYGGLEGNQWLRPGVLQIALVALALGFCIYAIEKEVHLHRLSRLIVDERVLNSALSKRLQQHSALMAAGRALNSVLDLDEVLDVILASALDMLRASAGSVMLLEGEDALRVVAVRGSETPRNARVMMGSSIAGTVARTREPIILNGPVDGERFPGRKKRSTAPDSAMCVPLQHRGHLLGVLNVSASGDRSFDEYDMQLLCLFAEPVAAAIAKAGLYEAERAHVAELLEAGRQTSQFVASVSHELRTPITSIRGAIAASRIATEHQQRAELLDVMERQALRLAHMVEEMLTAAKLERSESMPLLRRVDIAALIRMSALDSQVAGRPVELTVPEHCEVRADPESLRRIIGNLVENAHKYGAMPVRIVLDHDGDQIVLSVIDSGPGVPPAEREKIFDRFYRSDTNGEKPGVGLGLPIVRGLAEACGGSVWVEDAPGGGAAFRVSLRTRAVDEQEVAHVQ